MFWSSSSKGTSPSSVTFKGFLPTWVVHFCFSGPTDLESLTSSSWSTPNSSVRTIIPTRSVVFLIISYDRLPKCIPLYADETDTHLLHLCVFTFSLRSILRQHKQVHPYYYWTCHDQITYLFPSFPFYIVFCHLAQVQENKFLED